MRNPFTFEPEPFRSYSKANGEFETAFGEISSDEKAQASADAARRAARGTYDQYKTDCKGVRLLRRLTREPLDSTTKSTRLRKRVEQVPEIFSKIRLEDEKLKDDLKNARSEIQRESLRKQRRINVAKLLDQAGFDPRAKWTEASALAQARCELSEFNWTQHSLCDGKEVAHPGRFAKAVAEHYVRTEAGLSLNGQTARCEVYSIFCDVRFANGIVIRVNFSNIPDYFAAVQIAPRTRPKREYRYSCFRGQINLSPNQNALPAGDWPHRRTFRPDAPTIPSGPYQVPPPTCNNLQSDYIQLHWINTLFNGSVESLDKLAKQKPRNEPLFNETAERAKKEQSTLVIALKTMITRTRSGWYFRDGCSHRDIAKITCKIRKLPGVWLRNPTIASIKKLRDQLVYWLRRSRGAYSDVDCRSGVESEAEAEGGPLCGAAAYDLGVLSNYVQWLSNELKKTRSNPNRLVLRRRLVVSQVRAIVDALGRYIEAGCCEPNLKLLEAEVNALSWPTDSAAQAERRRLVQAIKQAQAEARKDHQHC